MGCGEHSPRQDRGGRYKTYILSLVVNGMALLRSRVPRRGHALDLGLWWLMTRQRLERSRYDLPTLPKAGRRFSHWITSDDL